SSSSSEVGNDEAAIMERAPLPADPRATAATKTVLANLHSFNMKSGDPFDHRILIGQQESDTSSRSMNGTTMFKSDLEKVTGKAAGLVSYELSFAYPRALNMFDAAAFREGSAALRELVLDKHKKGVLVSFVWHLRCPKNSLQETDKYSADECPADYNLSE